MTRADLVAERGVSRDPETGCYVPDPAVQKAREARRQALRNEVRAATAVGQVPDSLVSLWQDELALLLEDLQAMTVNLAPTTTKGNTSRRYRTFMRHAMRARELARDLGLSAAETAAKPKAWSKLSRAEQEAEAARALAEVERHLRAKDRGPEDEDN